MCHLVRQPYSAAQETDATVPPGTPPIRPRWAGAAAAALIGGLALAALFAPTSTATLVVPPQEAAPVAPVKSEKAALSADDGVPTAAIQKSGDCHHWL